MIRGATRQFSKDKEPIILVENFLVANDQPSDWKASARFANLALRAGLKVLWAMEPVRGRSEHLAEPVSFPTGSYVLPLYDTAESREKRRKNTLIQEAAAELRIKTETLNGELEGSTAVLSTTRVALYGDAGSPFPFASVLSEAGFDFEPITSVEIRNDHLNDFDVLILPGGGDEGPPIQSDLMAESGRNKVKQFIYRGGSIWGSCAGCCNLILYPMDSKNKSRPWEGRDKNWGELHSLEVINSEYWSSGMSGVGRLVVSNVRPDHPVMFGMPREFEMTWHLGPFLSPTPRVITEASESVPLLQMKGFTKDWTSAEYLNSPGEQLSPNSLDNTYAGNGIRSGRYGLMVGNYGLGKVCASAGHPEFGSDLLLEKWGLPARMVCNFLFWATASSSSPVDRRPPLARMKEEEIVEQGQLNSDADVVIAVAGHLLDRIKAILEKINQAIGELLQKSNEILQPLWLSDDVASATFGRSAVEKWPILLQRLSDLPDEIGKQLDELSRTEEKLQSEIARLEREETSQSEEVIVVSESIKEKNLLARQLEKVYDCMNYSRPPEWKQDYGWQGVLVLLDSANLKVRQAVQNYGITNSKNATASSSPTPYELVWDYYLGALFDLINALTLLRARNDLALDAVRASHLCSGFGRKQTGQKSGASGPSPPPSRTLR